MVVVVFLVGMVVVVVMVIRMVSLLNKRLAEDDFLKCPIVRGKRRGVFLKNTKSVWRNIQRILYTKHSIVLVTKSCWGKGPISSYIQRCGPLYLQCIEAHYCVLYNTSLYRSIMNCTTVNKILSYSITAHYIVLQHTTLYHTALHCNAAQYSLFYTALHSTKNS